MPGLAATGELTYNGYTFDGASHISVEQVAVMDDSGRSIKESRITITVQAIVTEGPSASDTLDDAMEDIRSRLMHSGQTLIFRDKGFGRPLIVNRGKKRDLNYGPHPEVLTWVPVGDNRAAEITWRVTTTISPCQEERSGGIKQLQWGINWSISATGLTTRSLDGFIEIQADKVGTTSADSYRTYFAPKLIAGFKRAQNWTLAPSKARIDFSIVDEEINSQSPYPAFVTQIDVRTRVSWRRGKESFKPTVSISGTIAMMPGVTPAEAYAVFHTIASQRLLWARRRGMYPFIMAIDIEEDIFNRPQSFGISYTLFSQSKNALRFLIGNSGLWRPIGTDWRRWASSLSDTVFSNRGSAQLEHFPGDDVVVDLCVGNRRVSPNNLQLNASPSPGDLRMSIFQNEKPPEESSWQQYDSAAIPYRDQPAVRQSPIQEPDDDNAAGTFDPDTIKKVPSVQAIYGPPSRARANVPDIIQIGGSFRYGMRLAGSARRVGYPIPRPKLERVGNQVPVEVASKFMQRVVDNYFGVDVFEARWAIDYIVPTNPGTIQIPVDVSSIG